MDDVARVAGVSAITVSRALRTPEKVRPLTLERVLAAVKATSYQVNPIASSLRSGRSSFVSVFVSSLRNEHFANAVQGALDAFEGSRFRLLFEHTGSGEELAVERVQALQPLRPAAIMVTGAVGSVATRDLLRGLGVPVMELWAESADPVDMLANAPAHEGGRLVGRHLAGLGRRSVAYVGSTGPRAQSRLKGLADGLAESGVQPGLIVALEKGRLIEDGMSALDVVMERLPGCDAIFFGSDVLAAGGMLRALERSIDIPGQVAIAGYGDLYFAGHTLPALTSVNISDYQVGRRAGEMLLARLNGRPVDPRVWLAPVTLKARASTEGGPHSRGLEALLAVAK
ncbi:MAG: LacI family DNA-binding transcriptional regulator [Devosia sp.]